MSKDCIEVTKRRERTEFFLWVLFGKDEASLNEDLEEESATETEDEGLLHAENSFDSEYNHSKPVNNNVDFQPKTLQEATDVRIINNLIISTGREHLSWKREYVNSLPLELKYSVLNKIIHDRNLELNIRLESLEVFLDERTKFFSFILKPPSALYLHMNNNQFPIFQIILKLIPNLAPNIETIDLTRFITTTSDLKENFKFLFKRCTNLKSLRLNGAYEICPILDLIFEDFNTLDKDVQIGLQSIKIYNLYRKFPLGYQNKNFSLLIFSNIFIRLPNLESLGPFDLGAVINHYVKFHDTPLNLTYIYDRNTNLSTLEIFAKFCPKSKSITLFAPQKKVVENLYQLPLLTEIKLYFFNNNELINYLTRNGKKIKKLRLINNASKIEEKLLMQLCPNLKYYHYVDFD